MPSKPLRKVLRSALSSILGEDFGNLPDREFYRPRFSPWEGFGEFKDVWAPVWPHTIVSADRVWLLHALAQQAYHLPGHFWECGVYKGGTAIMLASVAASVPGKQLHLFDTFSGMPDVNPAYDNCHVQGDFADTSLEAVRGRVGKGPHIFYHPGFIPDTFKGLESERIALVHVDVDIYQSAADCCAFIYPRLCGGGFMVFDDYGFPTCAGARAAVDQFFAGKPERVVVLPTGQAFVTKLP